MGGRDPKMVVVRQKVDYVVIEQLKSAIFNVYGHIRLKTMSEVTKLCRQNDITSSYDNFRLPY